jgi:hypothetical protein
MEKMATSHLEEGELVVCDGNGEASSCFCFG